MIRGAHRTAAARGSVAGRCGFRKGSVSKRLGRSQQGECASSVFARERRVGDLQSTKKTNERGRPMFEKLTTPEEIFSFKLGSALTMEKTVLGMLA